MQFPLLGDGRENRALPAHGGGPFVPGVPDGTGAYPNAVYYASQDIADANATISRDGGLTFGPAIPIYTTAQCGGLHGHIKVAPDGTVYVPNKGCADLGITRQYQAVVVSENEGTTWTVRKVSTSKPGGSDPSVGIALTKPAGQLSHTVYFGYVNADGHPRVAVSRDRGLTWTDDQDVGVAYGTVNTVFPAVVAGDDDRAAFAYLGTSTPGPSTGENPSAFNGEWNLYVATTYDGGKTWLTVDATPADPVQRSVICTKGTLCASGTRNLLDFMDATVDKLGRVLVGYADGCIGGCVQGGSNSGTARATIARQSDGRTLFAANDPVTAKPPQQPLASATLSGSTVNLSWSTPADGGSPITGYNIYRGSDASLSLTLLASLPATEHSFADISGSSSNFYYVTAVNAVGESPLCDKVSASAAVVQDSCTGAGARVVDDPTGDQTGKPLNSDLDVQSVSIAEPASTTGDKLVFTMKVQSLITVPADRQWRIIWTPATPPSLTDDRYYVGMTSTAPGVVSYEYGTVSANGNVPTTLGAADAGSYAQDGTIRITVANSKVGSPKAGDTLKSLSGRNFAGTGLATLTKTSATDATADSSYTLVGNAYCANTAPIAALSASPTSGIAPLTVSFSGAASSDPDARDSIASYTFAFGDGTSVTTTAPTATAQHQYATAGNYTASLTVTDSRGAVSTNPASVAIKVDAPQPDLVVTALTSSNNQAKQGDKITFWATIKNQGQASAGPSNTEFLLDSTTVLGTPLTPPTGTLAPGASTTVSVQWQTTAKTPKGNHTIRATADRNGAVAESNEGNNIFIPDLTFFLQGNKTR